MRLCRGSILLAQLSWAAQPWAQHPHPPLDGPALPPVVSGQWDTYKASILLCPLGLSTGFAKLLSLRLHLINGFRQTQGRLRLGSCVTVVALSNPSES